MLFLVDGRGLRPHAAWLTGVRLAKGDAELRLRAVVSNPFPAMAASARGCCNAQTLLLHAL